MQAANDEAQHFLTLSRQLEQGGEVAHSDVIKAQIQANDQQRGCAGSETRGAKCAAESLAVLLFPEFLSGLHPDRRLGSRAGIAANE